MILKIHSKTTLFIVQDAINFCWEIPGLCPLGAVSFQRLFNTGIANLLSGYIGKGIMVDGDDLLVQDEFLGTDKQVRESGKSKRFNYIL